MRILIVEDDNSIRDILKTIVEATFPESKALAAECGQDALRAVNANGMPELILLDLGLPDMSGFEVLAALRDKGCAAKVIVITAEDGPIQRSRAARMDVDFFIAKPFDSRALRTIMSKLLNVAIFCTPAKALLA